MNVMIIASHEQRSRIWARHLERLGADVCVITDYETAISQLHLEDQDVIILELILDQGGALALSDFISYRQPNAKVIFISDGRFFSDGSIFAHCANACAYLPSATAPEDIAALAEHHAQTSATSDPLSSGGLSSGTLRASNF